MRKMAKRQKVGRTRNYIPKEDQAAIKAKSLAESDATTFKLRALSAKARALVQDALIGGDESGVVIDKPGTGMYVGVQYGIAGWSNYHDAETGDVVEPEFVKGQGHSILSEKSMDDIADFVPELYGQIMAFNRLADDDLGNSTSSPKLSLTGSSGEAKSAASSSSNVEDVAIDANPE